MNWNQLTAVLWLRWRLTRNQWARGGGIGAVLAAVVAVVVIVLAVTSFVAALAVGVWLMGDARPVVVNGVWLGLTAGFLMIWMVGLIQDLQRSESIDLQRLMHLPVALGQIFVVNYVASHLAVSVIVFVPAMIGLAIGLAVSRGGSMLLAIPLALSMVFMTTAWTYYLRGWLATLMSNPRRRRAVIMGVTAGFILLSQLPNLYFSVMQGPDRPKATTVEEKAARREANRAGTQRQIDRLMAAERVIPPLWVAAGAQALAEGRMVPALLGTLGCFAIGAFGLRRAYRSTVRFHQGGSGGKAPAKAVSAPVRAPSPAAPPVAVGRLFMERRLPGVPGQSAALALATFQSMLRAPEVKMQWGASFLVMLIVGASLLFRATSTMPESAKPFVATGVVMLSLFLLVQFLANQFGIDRDGFRALVLSPAERRLLLIGKNLATLPAGAVSGLALLAIVTAWLQVSPIVFVATVIQLFMGLLIAGIGGNLLSILFPYRIQAGSLKPTKLPGLAMLMLVLSQLLFPLFMTPMLLPPLAGFLWERLGGASAALVNLTLSLLLAGATAFIYWKTLGPLGRLLQQRETKILAVVTVDVD